MNGVRGMRALNDAVERFADATVTNTLSVSEMWSCNPDYSSARNHGLKSAPTPTGHMDC